ncbi:GNAT family N-acetyltransferase [Nonomuraea sp. NPDC050790]|uniref:GNAT family N-acetyltransferase n=1 Tax=Nonomuraea sp. NPDC050790 TaxID=3364371 RepID=UPI0037B2AC01
MSDLDLRELHDQDEFAGLYRLFDDIWRPEPGNPPVTVELMKVFSHTGGYVAGAFRDGELVGGSVGILAAGGTLHSHVTGALPGQGIGMPLKLHQREWALERGITRITWTFDPLVRRNARFNLVKLGARPEEYLEDFYGVMGDAINEGDRSDRLLAVWRLEETAAPYLVERATAGVAERDGLPVVGSVDGPVVLVATPRDIETLRRENPEAGRAWRTAVREVLGGLMGAGARVVAFTDRGEYVLNLSEGEQPG